jgi:hypothetical protein
MRLPILFLLPLISIGCTKTQTILIQPGQPIRVLAPITAPGKSTAAEVAKDQWIVNDAAVILPAGAYVVVLPATSPSTKP